jgi:hypothetical protein
MLQLTSPGGPTDVVPALQRETRPHPKIRMTGRTTRLRKFPLEQCLAKLPEKTHIGLILDVMA